MYYIIPELVLGTAWWFTKTVAAGTYNLGYYMVYGKTETTEERLLKQIEKMEEERRKEKEFEAQELQKMKIILYSRYATSTPVITAPAAPAEVEKK